MPWSADDVLALRRSLGLSQAAFARRLGVRQQTVSEWETGRYLPRGASARILGILAEEVAPQRRRPARARAMTAALPLAETESALVARWLAGISAPLRLQDGRSLRVIFPGIPGAGHGPDVRDALLDVNGDYLRGDVEFHLLTSGWAAHGHAGDPAYRGVVLHVVAHDDRGVPLTAHASGRSIPLLVLPSMFPPGPPAAGFTPPCALLSARGGDVQTPLRALAARRFRLKVAAALPLVATSGGGPALYALMLRTLGGPANGAAFAAVGERLPLPALLERAERRASGVARSLALSAALKGEARDVPLRRSGMRPAAAPERRLEAAAALVALLWPGPDPSWPPALLPGCRLPRLLQAPGVGRALATELALNALFPVATAAAAWSEDEALAAWYALPVPAVYGVLRSLEGWLGRGESVPFASAAAVQGGLLLHADYCSRGRCGRCPLSS